MSNTKSTTKARKPKKALTASEKSKAIPADQLTKEKASTELAKTTAKKEKTTTIADFRRALVIGRENNDKYAKNNGKGKISLVLMDKKGGRNEFTIEYTIKIFTSGDWVKYHAMQKTTESGKEVDAMSRYAAAVIVGCLDDDGKRVFAIGDAEKILDKPVNSVDLMLAAQDILVSGGATEDQDVVEKPD